LPHPVYPVSYGKGNENHELGTERERESIYVCVRACARLLILIKIRKNCLSSGRSLLLYQFTRKVMKLTVAIIVRYRCYQLPAKYIQYPSLKVMSIHGEVTDDPYCWVLCNRSTADQIFFLHLLDTGEKMGVQ
jgi:hypothetical protein